MSETTTMQRRKTIRIDNDVREVLSHSVEISGNELRITGARLDPKLYKKCDAILSAIGGKWTKKVQAHVFKSDPKAVIAEALGNGEVVNAKQTSQFFETPQKLARRMIGLADISDSQQILEPSAGRGALIRAMQEKITGFLVTAVESDKQHIETLKKFGVEVHHDDFLKWTPGTEYTQSFDRIIANPPFNNGQDMAHVKRMWEYLAPRGRIVTVMSCAVLDRDNAGYPQFREFLEINDADIEELPRGAFAESGTDVPAILVVINKADVTT